MDSLTAICSDHRPILLDCKYGRRIGNSWQAKFKYGASWAKEDGCGSLIEVEWYKEVACQGVLASVYRKLDLCRNRPKK